MNASKLVKHCNLQVLTPIGFKNMFYQEWMEQEIRVQTTICVHGLSRNSHDFDFLAKYLSKYQHRVICPDILGRGKSDYLLDAALYNFPQYLSDLNALIARADVKELNWVGTSMGGLLGLILAAQPNTPIKKLVLNDIGPYISLDVLQKVRSVIKKCGPFESYAQAEQQMQKKLSTFGPLTSEQLAYLMPHNIYKGENNSFYFFYDPALVAKESVEEVNLWPLWANIKCPILIIRGEQSQVLSPELLDQMHTSKPGLEVLEVKDTGHAPMLMNEEQTRRIEKFLSSD